MITADLRRAIVAAAGHDPLLRPGPRPGSYTSSLPFRLNQEQQKALTKSLNAEPWIKTAEIAGHLTVTVTHDALATVAVRIVAAGATLSFYPERAVVRAPETRSPVAEAVAYAGPDAVRYALAATPPGGVTPSAEVIARQVLGNPAYAVRYAHAAAAAVLRWAAALDTRPGGFRPRQLTAPQELALLDALSWLPERVAMAARRGRPDEFAGYLAELAACTLDTMSTTGFTKISSISSERLWLADAARTGLAAGLELLGVDAPERI